MIVLLNGALGVGKTETAWELLHYFDRAAILDCDYVGGNVYPFDFRDPVELDRAYASLANLALHQQKRSNIHHFVVSGVFETSEDYQRMCGALKPLDMPVRGVLLCCNTDEAERRIRIRGHSDVDRELARALELDGILRSSSKKGDIGEVLDTSGLTIRETCDLIANRLGLKRCHQVGDSVTNRE